MIDNLKDIAREIAELAFQNEELTKRIMKHQKNKVNFIFIVKNLEIKKIVAKKQEKVHNYDLCVKRLYELNRFQQNRRAEMQFQLFQKEVQELTWTPEISAYSRKLAAFKTNNVPLYLRVDQCLENKKKNIETIKKNRDLEKEMKEIGNFYKKSL